MVDLWFGNNVELNTFEFTFTSGKILKLTFDSVRASKQARCFKRRRPLWDIDGGSSEGKKKRRLRFNLITSRLSKPFSSPATNIINRGSSKIAVWAKNRKLDKNLLRKGAIMNRVRSTLDAAKAIVHQETIRPGIGLKELMVHQRSKVWELPPSPLGLSNYDALDLEDDCDDEGTDDIYSDFNIMKPYSPGDESYDYLDELDGIPTEILDDTPPPPDDEQLTEMLKEKERHRELCFVKFAD